MIRTYQLIWLLLVGELLVAGCSASPDPEPGQAKTEKARLAETETTEAKLADTEPTETTPAVVKAELRQAQSGEANLDVVEPSGAEPADGNAEIDEAGSGQGGVPETEPAQPETADAEPTVTDFELIEKVITDLIEFKDFHPWGGRGARIVLSNKTCSHSGIGDNQLNGESRGDKDKLVLPDIITDLQRRNPGESLSLANLKPRNINIVVEDLSDKKETELEYQFNEKYPDARGYVEAWLPGFSKDGNTAVVRVRFGPSAHGATATYMLIKRDGRWRVKWRRTAYYL